MFVQVDGKWGIGSMPPKKMKTFYEQFPANQHYVNKLSYFDFWRVRYVNLFRALCALKLQGFSFQFPLQGRFGHFSKWQMGQAPHLVTFL